MAANSRYPPNDHDHDDEGRRIFRVREPITLLKNGKLLKGYVQINVAVWKALGGGVLALASFVGALVVLLDLTAVPKIRDIARAEAAPVAKQLVDYQERNERHLEQLVMEARATHERFLTREEFSTILLERQKKIDEMAAQIEFLYRNEIQKKQRGGG